MLILGAQVLIGFGFQAAFQPGFQRLPPPTQELKLVGLALMLGALGLLMAPGAFHQIAEGGNDSPRLIQFTGRVAAVALLPFAIGIGMEVYIVAQTVLGDAAAVPLGVAGLVFALVFWYGLEWVWRALDESRGIAHKEQRVAEPTSLENKIKQVLTEARVVLPGAQALLGFQLTAMLTDAFEKLPKGSQYVHVASLCMMAITIVFLMSPAAFHRIVERGEDTERLHRFSSIMLLAALVPLGFGIAADFYVVLDKVLNAPTLALGLSAASLVFFFGLWFGVTLAVRAVTRRHPARGPLRVSRAVR